MNYLDYEAGWKLISREISFNFKSLLPMMEYSEVFKNYEETQEREVKNEGTLRKHTIAIVTSAQFSGTIFSNHP